MFRDYTTTKHLLASLLILLIVSGSAFAQKRLRFVVYEVGVTGCSGCDGSGWYSSNNDHYWSWEGGSVTNECYGRDNVNPNYTINPGDRVLFDQSYNCTGDWPTGNLNFTWYVDEADGVCGCALGSLTCSDNSQTQSYPYPATTNGTFNQTQRTLVGGGDCGCATYTYRGRWEVSGNFIPEDYNNDMCNRGNMGTFNFNTTASLTNQRNDSPCDDCQGGEPNCSSDPSVWYSFTTGPTVAHEVYVNIDATGGGLDAWVGVYFDPANCNTLNDLVMINSASSIANPFGTSDATVTLSCIQPNTTYWVQVDGLDVTGDNGTFNINITDNGQQAGANNAICNATNLGTLNFGGNIGANTYNNFCANTQPGEPVPSAFAIDQTVWYRFTTGSTMGRSMTIAASNDPLNLGDQIDLQVALYTTSNNTCTGTFTEVDSDYDPFVFAEDLVIDCPSPNTTYWVQVDGSGLNVEGYFGLFATDDGVATATGDNICGAVNIGALPFGGSINNNNLNNFCAGLEPGEPASPGCIYGIDETIWVQFTTGAQVGHEVTLSSVSDPLNLGDDIDLQLAVYESSNNLCSGTLTEVGCDYLPDVPPFYTGEDLTVRCLRPNTPYWVQLDGSSINLEGHIGLTVTDDGVPVANNDSLCNATPLGAIPALGSVSLTNQNNYCGGIEAGEPDPLSFDIEQTVWYSFYPPPSGSVEIELLNSGSDDIDLQVSVWESSDTACTGIMTEIDSYDDPFSFSITGLNKLRIKCLDPNLQYFVQVDGIVLPLIDWLVEGTFDLTITDYNVTPAPNDTICDAIPLGNPVGGSVGLTNQNNFCADNYVEPYPTEFGTNQTVWYTFIAPPTGRVNIVATSDPLNTGDYIDLQLAVYELANDTCTGLPTEIKSEYNDLLEWPPLSRDEEMLVECLIPGKEYWLMVDGSDDPDDVDGWFDIEVFEEPGPPPITNDAICNATPFGQVPSGGSVGSNNEHNFCATTEPGEPVPTQFGIDATVWYTFRAPATGNVTVNMVSDPLNFGDNVELQVAIYESSNNTCTGTMTEVGSDYDPLAPVTYDEDLTVTCLDSGRIYWVQVDGANFPPPPFPPDWLYGYFGITISEDPGFPLLPTNDSICNAVHLGTPPSGGSTPVTAGSNYCATEETGEPNVSGGFLFFSFPYDETVWFTFTTNANPGTVNVEISNTAGIDANMNVYRPNNFPTCNFNDLVQIASADNLISSDVDVDLECLAPNTTYYVQVDGLDLIGDYGTFDIQVHDDGIPLPQSPNDSICAAVNLGTIPVGGSSALVSGNNLCASEEPGEPNVSGFTLITNPFYDETVWYTFTTSNTPGLVTVDITNAVGIDATMVVYAVDNFPSCNFNDLHEYDSADNLLSNDVSLDLECLLPNTTYYIQVDGVDLLGDQGTFDIQVTDDGNANVYAPYDDICSAGNLGVVASGGGSTISTNNFCATEESGEPNVSGGSIPTALGYDETVWFIFTTSATPGLTTITVNNTVGIDAGIHIYAIDNGPTCNFSNLIEIENADDAFSGNVSVDIPCLPPNTSFYVQVDGDDVLGPNGTFDITVSDNGLANGYAPNDSICNATPLGVVPSGGQTAAVSSHNFCAGEEPGEPNVSGSSFITTTAYDETVWFTFTTSATPGTITVDVFNTTSGGLDGVINVYDNLTPSLCQFSNLDFLRGATTLSFGDVSVDLVCLEPNTTYWVQVDGLDVLGDHGTFDIRVSDDGFPVLPPAYNEICSAVALGNPSGGSVGPFAGNNNCANDEFQEPGVNGDDETVWFTFIAPPSGSAQVLINSTAFLDANFSLYHANSGSCDFDSLQQVGSNHDNFVSFSVDYTENCLIPGHTYYVQIDGNDILGNYGNFTITVNDGNPSFAPPTNDPCSSAIPITVQNAPCQGSGLWNMFNYGNPTVSYNNSFVNGCGDNCGDIWYSFTMPSTGQVVVEGNDDYGFLGLNNSELTVAAYQGPCNNLTPIACDQGGLFGDPEFYVQDTPGTTIFLQVFDDGGDDDNQPFALCVSSRCGADSCTSATPMTPGVPYCFDTDGATGETNPGNSGYLECGDGQEPENSVYFTYTNNCPDFEVVINANIGGACLLGEPTDGLGFELILDDTPCDWNPDTLVDCQQSDVCLGNTWYFRKTYSGFPIGSTFVIQLEGIDIDIPGFSGGDNSGFIQINELCPLPIDDLRLSGYHDGSANQLFWTAMGDPFNGRFEMEKSLDGDTFERLANIDGQNYQQAGGSGAQGGSSSGGNDSYDYRLTDHRPVPGHNFYRVKFIDRNGNSKYSEVVDLFVGGNEELQLMGLYPNPARDEVNLDIFVAREGDYEVSVTDMYGKVIYSRKSLYLVGLNKETFDLKSITSGMYMVKIRETGTQSKAFGKFIKQ